MKKKSPAVLFITFDRFDVTKRVFEQIRSAKPERLYLVSDGACPSKSGQQEKVQEIRNYLLENIDWECSVSKLFREKNWGCDINIPNAIDWFFETEEMGIILEDDCLPGTSFFEFCSELLLHYMDNKEIFMISGDRFTPKRNTSRNSYRFSTLSYSWGWATWRDRWKKMKTITQARTEISPELIPSIIKGNPKKYWNNQIQIARQGKSTWDVDWQLTLWANQGLSILPNINLIQNIGVTGTHMKPYDPCVNLPMEVMPRPLVHPNAIQFSEKLDTQTEKLIRRSVLKNIQLISTYIFSLPFRRDKKLIRGMKELLNSLAAEIRHRKV